MDILVAVCGIYACLRWRYYMNQTEMEVVKLAREVFRDE
jgi:hypothetical protein